MRALLLVLVLLIGCASESVTTTVLETTTELVTTTLEPTTTLEQTTSLETTTTQTTTTTVVTTTTMPGLVFSWDGDEDFVDRREDFPIDGLRLDTGTISLKFL